MIDAWKFLGHGPLLRLEPNLWAVEGPHPRLTINRWMVVARLADGRLIMHNPVALDGASMLAIEQFGTLTWVVIPNRFHGLDAVAFKQRYPRALVVSPEASAVHLRKQKKTIDSFLTEVPADDTVSLEPLDGVKGGEAVMRVTSPGGHVTLAFGDALFNMPHGSGFVMFMLRLIGSTGGPRVTRLMQLAGVSDKKALAAHLRRLSATPGLVRLIPGHGQLIDRDAPATLAAVADRLAPE